MFKKSLLIIFISMTVIGCTPIKKSDNPLDPYEASNRKAFKFNRHIDKKLLRPAAVAYDKTAPKAMKTGIKNFFDNLRMIRTMINDALQANFETGFTNLWRFTLNSTIGLGGILDVSTQLGLPYNQNDLGLTFAVWGSHKSPYQVLLFFGPSTWRDSIAMPVDYFAFSPLGYIKPFYVGFSLAVLRFIDFRAQLLGADKLLDDSFDPYIFMRNAYLQVRNKQLERVTGVDIFQEKDTVDDGEDADEDDPFIEPTEDEPQEEDAPKEPEATPRTADKIKKAVKEQAGVSTEDLKKAADTSIKKDK